MGITDCDGEGITAGTFEDHTDKTMGYTTH